MLPEMIAAKIASWVGTERATQRASAAFARALPPCQIVWANAEAAMNKAAVIRAAERLRTLIWNSCLNGQLTPVSYVI